MEKFRNYLWVSLLLVSIFSSYWFYGVPSVSAQTIEVCTDINATNYWEPLPCDIPLDLCPNRSGNQSSLPPWFIIDDETGYCTEFICEDPLANNIGDYFSCSYAVCPYNDAILINDPSCIDPDLEICVYDPTLLEDDEDCIPPVICEDEEADNFEEEWECTYTEPPTPPSGWWGWWGGWGWGSLTTDDCPDGDFSSSYYDGECGILPPTPTSTPIELLETGPTPPTPTDTPPIDDNDLPKTLLTTGAKSPTTMLYMILTLLLLASTVSTRVLLTKTPLRDEIIY